MSDRWVTNSGYHVGYQFKKKQFFEVSYSEQDYVFFRDFLESPVIGGASEGNAINIGARYKYNFFSMPLSVLAYRSKSPFSLMAFAGCVFQFNKSQVGSFNGSYLDFTTNEVILKTNSHTEAPQFLLQAGLEAEFPLYKDVFLTASYTWYFGVGQKMMTTHYTGVSNGMPLDGYRYSDGGGQSFSLGLRWYLPGGTNIPTPNSLTVGRNFYLGAEYFIFLNANSDPNVSRAGKENNSVGLLAGYRKSNHIFETGITPLPSSLGYQTDFPLAGATVNERRWYLPLRYKRGFCIFKKGQSQNLEFLPSAGMGVHLPILITTASSYFPDGSLASDHQKVNNLVVGAELGAELAINAKGLTFALQARYLHGFSNTRQLQLFDNNAQPTANFVSSTPTGWLHGVAVRYRLGK
ncbi:MAG: hypothetical protein ACKO13_08785 [Cytophagales bacterium]